MNICFVISQQKERLRYTVAEAWKPLNMPERSLSHDLFYWLHLLYSVVHLKLRTSRILSVFFSDFRFGYTINKIQISILCDCVCLQRCDTVWFLVPDNSHCHCHACEVLRPCRSLSSKCDIIYLAIQLFTGKSGTMYQLDCYICRW
jgi:hypothetical protein